MCPSYCMQAPEVFDMSYGFPADVWSAGVTMYWILSGDFPFKGRNKVELARRVYSDTPSLEGGVWEYVTTDAKELVRWVTLAAWPHVQARMCKHS